MSVLLLVVVVEVVGMKWLLLDAEWMLIVIGLNDQPPLFFLLLKMMTMLLLMVLMVLMVDQEIHQQHQFVLFCSFLFPLIFFSSIPALPCAFCARFQNHSLKRLVQ